MKAKKYLVSILLAGMVFIGTCVYAEGVHTFGASVTPTEATAATGNVGTTAEEKEKVFTTNYNGAYVYFRAIDKARNIGPWSTEPQRLYIDINSLASGESEYTGEEPIEFTVPEQATMIKVEGQKLTKTLQVGDDMAICNNKTWLRGKEILTKDDFEEWEEDEDAYILRGYSYVRVTPGKTYTITPTNADTIKISWSETINNEELEIVDL